MQKRCDGIVGDKSGQVTIFVIIAIVIVGAVLLYLFVLPGSEINISDFNAENPQGFMQTCLNEKVIEVVQLVSMQGGSIEPEHYFTYNEIPVEYLCYINEDLKPCVVQQPLLKQHIESEIEGAIGNDVQRCFDSLKKSYEGEGYNVALDTGLTRVELLPNRINVDMNYILTTSKSETTRFDDFRVTVDNNLYELVSIANSIIEWETALGDADPRIYGRLDSNIIVDKNLRDDGTKIYKIEEVDSGNVFQLASRSLVFPVGY